MMKYILLGLIVVATAGLELDMPYIFYVLVTTSVILTSLIIVINVIWYNIFVRLSTSLKIKAVLDTLHTANIVCLFLLVIVFTYNVFSILRGN